MGGTTAGGTVPLDGKVAIVSGGARGIGAAVARQFVEAGAQVVIGDVLDEEGEQMAATLGGQASYASLDVTDAERWAEVVRACQDRFGPPTVLVNNAGVIGEAATVDELDELEFRRVLDVNLVGTFLGTRAVADPMIRAGGGSIVNISSTAGFVGAAGRSAYTASKFAVRGFTKATALELGHHGIRVNSVHPGSVDTELVTRSAAVSFFLERQALPRLADAGEIARLVVFVASDAASFSTGGEFVADGGFLAGTA